MPSIIKGYNYDIFISYRQKDNKHDGWVTEFVDNLKGEIEATFKEDISIYFDANPQDGLLETHIVNESLSGKLRCLIFIPVISQTYCDPQSFAWQNEFCVFNKLAKGDWFGRDIRLHSGDVASRILPVKIRDLDPEDKILLESEIGGVLRCIEFIYKSAGVNRPLRANEDHPHDNLNKTFYRDQINKVTNVIKEIIEGLKSAAAIKVKEKTQLKEPLDEFYKESKLPERQKHSGLMIFKLKPGVAILSILFIAALFIFPKIFEKSRLEKLRTSGEISVAVMPFQNMTNDAAKNFWQDLIQNNLITFLSNSEELQIRQTESIMTLLQNNDPTNYASITSSVASRISQKLNAKVFIHGSINQIGTTIRINAKLIDSETEEVFKSFQIDGTDENILQIADSLSVMVYDFLIITILKKEASPFIKFVGSTKSPEALRNFINGQNAFYRLDYLSAREMYLNAIRIDSNFTIAAIFLAVAYGNQDLFKDAKKWCLKAYGERDNMPRLDKLITEWAHALYFGTPTEELKYLRQMLDIDNQQAIIYYQLGSTFNRLYQYDKAIPEFEKSLEIYNQWDMKPNWIYSYTDLGNGYHETGQHEKERRLYKEAEQVFPNNSSLVYRQAILSFTEGDTIAANRYIERYISIQKDNSASEADIRNNVARIYEDSDILGKAEANFRQALRLEPENPVRIYNLANFLIKNDLDIIEGLRLINKALNSDADSYKYLDCKGWGLYKQGRFKEALEFLEKSWELKPVYRHYIYLHLEATKKAVAGLQNN